MKDFFINKNEEKQPLCIKDLYKFKNEIGQKGTIIIDPDIYLISDKFETYFKKKELI